MTEPYAGHSTQQIATAASAETIHANDFVAGWVEKTRCWFDHRGVEMHDVFIVISEGADGARLARAVYAAGEDDARRAHEEGFADETIVAIHH